MEEAVKRAERILLDNKRQEIAKLASLEEKAEVLAQEIFHKQGSILTEKELVHIYEQSGCASLRPAPDCSSIPNSFSVRTITGVCNNLQKPAQGSSFTSFQRLIQPDYANGFDELFNQADEVELGPFQPPSPSARLVSNTTITDRIINSTNLTHLVVQWGQFMDHDLILSVAFPELECDLEACEQGPVCFPVRVPVNDKAFGVDTPRGGNCLPFQRTVPACPENSKAFVPREQVNEITHYIDGSMVYGSTVALSNFLRQFDNENLGRLKVSEGDNLPLQPPCAPVEGANGEVTPGIDCCPKGIESCFVAGDNRAIEHVSLIGIHTFWVREHNRIADALSALNPQWDEDRVFLEARDILIAEIQLVTYTNYLPALFGEQFDRLIGEYTGYDPMIDASIPNAFATAAYRFGHSQVQPAFERLGRNFIPIQNGPLSLRDSFFNQDEFFASADPTTINPRFATETDTLVRGLITQPARAVDEFINFVLTSQLFEPADQPGQGMDLATLNIQRGRDHGLPRYGRWKRFCRDMVGDESVFRNELTRIRLLQLYGMEDNIDLFIGALAEESLSGSALGAVTACIFSITFKRLRSGDRFFYENEDAELNLFTPDQLAEIRKTSLARIICDNTNIRRVQSNPFLQATPEERIDCADIPGIDFSHWNVSIQTLAYTNIANYNTKLQFLSVNFIYFFSSFSLAKIQMLIAIHIINFMCPFQENGEASDNESEAPEKKEELLKLLKATLQELDKS